MLLLLLVLFPLLLLLLLAPLLSSRAALWWTGLVLWEVVLHLFPSCLSKLVAVGEGVRLNYVLTYVPDEAGSTYL